MRIIIAGSRSVTDEDVQNALSLCSWIGFASAIVSGTSKGADAYGERWAEAHNIEIIRFPAAWDKHGRRAGPLRNKEMAENAEGLVAVWDGQSRGTHSMIELAAQLGLRIFILRTDTDTYEELPARGGLAQLWEMVEERAALKQFGGRLPKLQAEHEAAVETLSQRNGTSYIG